MGSTNRIGQAAWVQDEIHGPGRRCPRGALVHPLPSDVCTCTCTCSQADHTSSRDCTWCRCWRLGCCRRLHPRRPCLACLQLGSCWSPILYPVLRGPPWLGLELPGWRQPEVEKVQQQHQAPEYRDQTLDHTTLVDRIYNVNNAIFALYIHVIICLGQKKLVDFVIDTLYIHVLYTLTSRRLPTTF